MSFCNPPPRAVNPKANLHQPPGGSSCSASPAGARAAGGCRHPSPGSTFILFFYTSPLCNCSVPQSQPTVCTRAGQEAALHTLVYAPVTPSLHRAYAKPREPQPGPGSPGPAPGAPARPREPQPGHKLQLHGENTRPEPSKHNQHLFTCLAAIWMGLFSECFSLCDLHGNVFIGNWTSFLKGPRSQSSSPRQGSVILSPPDSVQPLQVHPAPLALSSSSRSIQPPPALFSPSSSVRSPRSQSSSPRQGSGILSPTGN